MESSSFFNSENGDRTYNAGDWADYFRPLFKTGVFNGDLQVVANGGMSVKVQTGYAWIDGYKYRIKDEPLTLDMETASGNMNRVDNIVVRLDLPKRLIKSYVVSGNYYQGAAMPKQPEISATIHEIIIARITVEAGTTEITQDLIEDTRMDGDLCGWVCGAVDQIKFEQIKAQFDAFFAKYQASIRTEYETYTDAITSYEEQQKADFEAWVDSLKDILDDADVARLQGEIDQALKKSDLIESLAITVPGKVMDGKTCSENLIKALGTTLTGTLEAGETTLIFTSAAITEDSLIDIYTNNAEVSPTEIVQNGNVLELTFDEQTEAVGVKVRVM